MSASGKPARKLSAPLMALSVLLVGAYGWLALSQSQPADAATLAPSARLVTDVSACSAPLEQARTRGLELERQANAHWERVPFDESEAPQAILKAQEAQRCLTLAQDREGRARAETTHVRFGHELAARVERRRLRLVVARRSGDLHTIAREADGLLALLSRSGDDNARYRESLVLLAQRARAQALEAAQRGEQR